VPEPEYVQARTALLDALEALAAHRAALVLVGAQAVYLHTGAADFAVPAFTIDADLALDPGLLSTDPLLEEAMARGHFTRMRDPGIWAAPSGVTVDLLVPESLGGSGGRRGARLGVHGNKAAHRAEGLEGCLVDKDVREVGALDGDDLRRLEIAVAGPAALIVAKVHKMVDIERTGRGRVKDKDALDVLRLLQGVEPERVVNGFERLRASDLARAGAESALTQLQPLFGSPGAPGCDMLARAVLGLADEEQMRATMVALVRELAAGLE